MIIFQNKASVRVAMVKRGVKQIYVKAMAALSRNEEDDRCEGTDRPSSRTRAESEVSRSGLSRR